MELSHKTVFGTATDGGRTVEDVRKQLLYIRLHFPELLGLVVYQAHRDSAELVEPTDNLFNDYFVALVIFCQPQLWYPGRVQIKNCGGQTA